MLQFLELWSIFFFAIAPLDVSQFEGTPSHKSLRGGKFDLSEKQKHVIKI